MYDKLINLAFVSALYDYVVVSLFVQYEMLFKEILNCVLILMFCV